MDKRTLYIAAALQGLCANPDSGINRADDNELFGEMDILTGRAVEIASLTLSAECAHFNDAPGPDIIVVDHLSAGEPHTKAVFIDVDDPRAQPIVDAVRLSADKLRPENSAETAAMALALLVDVHTMVRHIGEAIQNGRTDFAASRIAYLEALLGDIKETILDATKEPTNG